MRARSAQEAHRTATPLELLFDLVFVVAIAQAGTELHHAVVDGHGAHGLSSYAMTFFAIWWAWMNFTWFASAYDVDDLPYRLLVFVQMAGALILAAGVHDLFRGDFTVGVAGYVVMRLALVVQWLRAARGDPAHRVTALRYAVGVALLQVAWTARLFAPAAWQGPTLPTLIALELLVPVWAERAGQTSWHPHHITERYGLFTIIVLGESILAATLATRSALEAGTDLTTLLHLAAGGLVIVFALWWLYFFRPVHDLLASFPRAVVWGYGHYLVFASAAAVGAGLAVGMDVVTGQGAIESHGAGFAVAIPVACYLLSLWLLHHRPGDYRYQALGPLAAAVILLTPFTGYAVPLTALVLVTLLGIKLTYGIWDPA